MIGPDISVCIEVSPVDPTIAFLEVILEPRVIRRGFDRWRKEGTAEAVIKISPGWLRMSGLYVSVCLRKLGYGRAIVRRAQAWAAEMRVPLYLEAVPFGDRPPTDEFVKAWYERLGFRAVPGHPFAMVWHLADDHALASAATPEADRSVRAPLNAGGAE